MFIIYYIHSVNFEMLKRAAREIAEYFFNFKNNIFFLTTNQNIYLYYDNIPSHLNI